MTRTSKADKHRPTGNDGALPAREIARGSPMSSRAPRRLYGRAAEPVRFHRETADIMKKISASLFTSIDGVVGEPQTWHFPYYCDELGAAVTEQISENDTVLVGRVTYDSFAGAWPAREEAGGEDAAMAKAL